MRKLSKKISMLMVLAMLVGMFSGVVSASAASSWSFKSKNYEVAVDGTVIMENKEYADFDLLKDGKAPTGYTVKWASSDENVVWVNAKTGQLRANKLGMANIGDKAVISATFTNTATKKSATRSFEIVYGIPEYDYVIKSGDVVLGEETLTVGESYKLATTVLDEAGNSVDFKTCKLYRNYFIDGKAIANPYVPEKEGKVTIVVGAFTSKADMNDIEKAVDSKPVEVEVKMGGFSAKATGIKKITVNGEFAKDSVFTVKKDGVIKVDVDAKVADDLKSATLTLVNSRIGKGTYTVTCGDAKAEFEAEDEKVDSIIIEEEDSQVFVDSSRGTVYAHYDVFNQYGESIRKSVDVSFTSSADRGGLHPWEDPDTGIVEIYTNNLVDPFNYGDVVVLTATVLNFNGSTKTETANMTVGLQNQIHKIKFIGIVLEDTTELLDAVPVEFEGTGKYYAVFECYDRNDKLMPFDLTSAQSDLTFIALSPLTIKSVANVDSIYIKGVEYGTVELTKGDDVKKGGYADIKVTSKSGGVTDEKIYVRSNQILDSFRVIKPDNVIVRTKPDGSPNNNLELAFEAYDVEGNKITDFRALHNAVAFSGNVKLVEKNDYSAKLVADVSTVSTSKEVDGQFVFSVIIPSVAKAENVTLKVKHDRHADAIGELNGTTEILEGDLIEIGLAEDCWGGDDAKLSFYDQYDTEIAPGAFGGIRVGVKVVADGNPDQSSGHTPGIALNRPATINGYSMYNGGEDVKITAAHVTESSSDAVIEVVLYDPVKTQIIAGTAKRYTIKIVDLSKVVSFEINANNPTTKTNPDKLQNKYEIIEEFSLKGVLANGHKVDVALNGGVTGSSYVVLDYNSKGTYGNVISGTALGVSTNITPNFDVDNGLEVDPSNLVGTGNSEVNIFQNLSGNNIVGLYNLIERPIKIDATVYTIDGSLPGGKAYKGSVSKTVAVGVGKRVVSSLVVKEPTATVSATAGNINYEQLVGLVKGIWDNYGEAVNYDLNANPTGVFLKRDLKVTISNVKENARGYEANDATIVVPEVIGFKKTVDTNADTILEYDKTAAEYVMLSKMEIGDTFTVTYECEDFTETVNFTVGADTTAWFSTMNTPLTYK